MTEKKTKITNRLGMHARPSAMFVTHASKFESDIFIEISSFTFFIRSCFVYINYTLNTWMKQQMNWLVLSLTIDHFHYLMHVLGTLSIIFLVSSVNYYCKTSSRTSADSNDATLQELLNLCSYLWILQMPSKIEIKL